MGQIRLPLSSVYDRLSRLSNTDNRFWESACYHGLSDSEKSRAIELGAAYYQGKVRELLTTSSKVTMIHSDRLSAFDRFIGWVPFKGVILTHFCKFWFERLQDIVSTHYYGLANDRSIEAMPLQPIKAEVVIRGYLAGSIMRAYATGERLFCGVELPDGLRPFERLPKPIITPTTKAAAFEHDENISSDELISRGICSAAEWTQLEHLAHKVFAFGQETYLRSGWILADTKYEFGRDPSGNIRLMDEVHTPDSSRLWDATSLEKTVKDGTPPIMLDKENIRRFLLDKGFSGHGDVPEVPRSEFIALGRTYLGVLEKLTGAPLNVEWTGF